MRTDTQSVTIQAAPADVFAFLAEPENLPRWAIGFAKEIRREDGGWVVQTGQGQRVPVRVEADKGLGVIDFHMTPAPGAEAVAHSRVLPNLDAAEYVFTQFQSPGMTDEVFAAQVTALGHELVALKALLEVSCPL